MAKPCQQIATFVLIPLKSTYYEKLKKKSFLDAISISE